MTNNEKVIELSKIIIEKNGNISSKDVEKLGISPEVFLRLSQMKNDIIINNAKKVLKYS